mmetsp:Transcript_19326/g.47796  ORF Transcript_19326/g.47796 Transcript_19326/m.47796 type:complete len:133 (-) Transcript_19326:102-500(-)
MHHSKIAISLLFFPYSILSPWVFPCNNLLMHPHGSEEVIPTSFEIQRQNSSCGHGHSIGDQPASCFEVWRRDSKESNNTTLCHASFVKGDTTSLIRSAWSISETTASPRTPHAAITSCIVILSIRSSSEDSE